MVAIVPHVVVTGHYALRLRVCTREAKCSVSILQSPVTTILSEALRAPTSIKAYGAVMFMVRKHGAALDQLMSAKNVRTSLHTLGHSSGRAGGCHVTPRGSYAYGRRTDS